MVIYKVYAEDNKQLYSHREMIW